MPLIWGIILSNIEPSSFKAGTICGSLPSQKVSIATKFSWTSFPKRSRILVKIYFWFAVNLAFEDWATKQIALIVFKSFLNVSAILSLIIYLELYL